MTHDTEAQSGPGITVRYLGVLAVGITIGATAGWFITDRQVIALEVQSRNLRTLADGHERALTDSTAKAVELQKTVNTLQAGLPAAGMWQGTYTCRQGLTGLTLAISPQGEGELSGLFSFYAPPSNPGVPTGSFQMRGHISPTGTVTLFATDSDWIVRPKTYIVVGLAGTLDQKGGKLAGRVTEGDGGPSDCTTFSLERLL